MEIINVDSKGRVVIPAHIRQEIKTRRFVVEKKNSEIVFTPVLSLHKLEGRFKRGIRAEGLHDKEDLP